MNYIIEEIKQDLLTYIADKYLNSEYEEVQGENNFNNSLPRDTQKINLFSLGAFKTIPVNFLLVQLKSFNASRDILPNLGAIDYGFTATYNIYIEVNSTPKNAALISDIYINAIFNVLQKFIWTYTKYTLVTPNIVINKYFDFGSDKITDFNAIKKLIVSCDLTITTKTSELTFEEENII